MALSRDQILASVDRKVVEVPVPEWGGSVFVRTLSGRERDALDWAVKQALEVGFGASNARARFGAAMISDEQGQPLFTDQDVEALGQKSAAALERVFDAGSKLNALRKEDIDDLAKNSVPSRSAASSSI